MLIAAAVLTGCSKSEPPKAPPLPASSTSTAINTPAQDAASSNTPHKIVDYMAGLKDIRDYNKPVDKAGLENEAAAAVKAADAAKTASAAGRSGMQVQLTSPSVTAPSPAPTTSQPAPAPPKAPSDNTLAKAAAPIAAAAPTTTPVSREAPEFPREAVKAGIDAGTVHARMNIDASGNVTNVQIVEARPPRIFDRAVRETLGHWKFNNGSDARSYETEIEFRR